MRTRTAIVAGLAALATACGGTAPQRVRSTAGRPPLALGLTTRLPAAYRSLCARQAAAAPPRARTCPPLIPAGPLKVIGAGTLNRPGGEYDADIASPSIGGLNGVRIDANGGHWHYDAAWTPAARRAWVKRRIEHPRNGPRSDCRRLTLAAERVEACRVAPYGKGGGLHGGHVAYVWDHAGVTYAISLHGYANEPRVQVMMTALIERVRSR